MAELNAISEQNVKACPIVVVWQNCYLIQSEGTLNKLRYASTIFRPFLRFVSGKFWTGHGKQFTELWWCNNRNLQFSLIERCDVIISILFYGGRNFESKPGDRLA
jgi:hypothetical protein